MDFSSIMDVISAVVRFWRSSVGCSVPVMVMDDPEVKKFMSGEGSGDVMIEFFIFGLDTYIVCLT